MRTATTGAQAVDRAASLLVHVLRAHEPVAFPELVAATGLPKSTVSRLLGSLERGGLVARTQSGEVVPGDVVTAFARRHDPNDDILERARPALERLAAATGETVNLAVGGESGVVQLDQIDSAYLLGVGNWIDRQVPYHASASGKALLAHGHPLPAGRLVKLTDRTRTTRPALEADLRRCLERGYAITDSELEEGLVAVSAAVLGPEGRAIAAISVSGPSSRFTPRAVARAGALLVTECAALSSPLPNDTKARTPNRKEGAA